MLGSGNPTPYDVPAIIVLVLFGLTLLTGAILGPRWSGDAATLTRWSSAMVSALLLAAGHHLTPTTNGIIGAGRLITLWPAFAANMLLFALWTWRVTS
jgi:hypothetical protein